MIDAIETARIEIKKTKPLVLNLTNYVTMDFMANALLALGAAPIMTACDEELEELVALSNSLNINIGTLDGPFITRCHKVVMFAKQYNKPIVLDPVGAGATQIRTQTARALMAHATVIRGNASEIMSLVTSTNKTLGVESTNTTAQAKEAARTLALSHGLTVVVTGSIDFITNGILEAEVEFGTPLMALVTGMGCTLTAVIAAFCGIGGVDAFESAHLATQYFGLCGEKAYGETQNPGSFRTAFIDALYEGNMKSTC